VPGGQLVGSQKPQDMRTEDAQVFVILGIGIFVISFIVLVTILVISGASVPHR
jgi:hypothetical protein